MDKTLSQKARTSYEDICTISKKLTAEDRERLVWMAQGILLANKHGKEKS